MKTEPSSLRAIARSGQSGSQIIIVVTSFVVLLASGWMIGRSLLELPSPQTVAVPVDRHVGLIQLAPDDQQRCEQFEFDNRTAKLKAKGTAPCDDIFTASTPPNSKLTVGALARMWGISDYFKKR